MSSDYHVHSDGQQDSVALEAADLVVMCKKYTTGWDEWRVIGIFLCRKVTSPELPCNCSGAQRSSNQAVAHAEGRCAGEVRSQPTCKVLQRGEQHACGWRDARGNGWQGDLEDIRGSVAEAESERAGVAGGGFHCRPSAAGLRRDAMHSIWP